MSKAADVYAFGITMWELYTAGQPYNGEGGGGHAMHACADINDCMCRQKWGCQSHVIFEGNALRRLSMHFVGGSFLTLAFIVQCDAIRTVGAPTSLSKAYSHDQAQSCTVQCMCCGSARGKQAGQAALQPRVTCGQHTCARAHENKHTHEHIYAHMYTHVGTQALTHTYALTNTHPRTRICTRTCIRTCTCISTNTPKHMHTKTHTRITRTYVHKDTNTHHRRCRTRTCARTHSCSVLQACLRLCWGTKWPRSTSGPHCRC